jgi:membrane protein implicated in regulation of membrane protease activity
MVLCWARIRTMKNGSVARGDPVKVIAVDGLELKVERLEK